MTAHCPTIHVLTVITIAILLVKCEVQLLLVSIVLEILGFIVVWLRRFF